MKKIFNILALASAFVTLFTACSVNKERAADEGLKPIQFSASVGAYQVKATDTAFEEGDAIGLWGYNVIGADNARLVWKDGKLVPDTPIYWNSAMLVEDYANFNAYYPYMENLDGSGIRAAVQADQTTQAAYTASDFMTARAVATPAEGKVHLNFVHVLSKMVIDVENRLNDQAVTGICLEEVYTDFRFYAGDAYAWAIDSEDSKKSVIEAASVKEAEDKPVWTLILPPQNSTPVLHIYLADGTDYYLKSSNSTYFGSGSRYKVHAILDETAIPVDFGANVSDWFDNGDVTFDQPLNKGTWSVVGLMDDWNNDLAMTKVSSGVYTITINYENGEKFKFRKDSDWKYNFGITSEMQLEEGVAYELVQDGGNILLPYSGSWILTMNLNTMTMTATFMGNGSKEHPYIASAAYDRVLQLDSSESLTDVYVKGIISSIVTPYDSGFGNATFYITNDGKESEKPFYCYRLYYFGGNQWTDGDTQIQVGDEVVVYGTLVNYGGGMPETKSKYAYLYSLNGNLSNPE